VRAVHETRVNDLTRLLGLAGTLRIERIESAALANNPLGDPANRPLGAYVPPGYDPQGSQRYPVLYCLHGYTGDVAALVSGRAWETNVVQWIDRLIGAGRMPPAMLAIVDGFTRLGGSQYVDSIHNGAYATYAVRDAIGFVDATYRTLAREGGRAVFGKSSGGFGAMHLCLEYPGTFAAFASHSGDTYFRYACLRGFPAAQRVLEEFGSIEAFVQAFESRPKRPGNFGLRGAGPGRAGELVALRRQQRRRRNGRLATRIPSEGSAGIRGGDGASGDPMTPGDSRPLALGRVGPMNRCRLIAQQRRPGLGVDDPVRRQSVRQLEALDCRLGLGSIAAGDRHLLTCGQQVLLRPDDQVAAAALCERRVALWAVHP